MPGVALTTLQPMIDAMIDTPPSSSGYTTAAIGAAVTSSAPSTIVAISVTAYVSNRSAAMPAQSPTLSPTLSAITAGLRGSSSGMPASTLPTRSAPTSAPLVKMPPPSRAKIEISDEPKASPISGLSAVDRSALSEVAPLVSTQKTIPTPSSPSPTTSMPVIAPPLNATFSASFMPLVAACAVRTLARTDTFMPMNPQAPDSSAPMTNATAVGRPMNSPISTASTTPTMAMVRYWRAR